MPPQTDNNYTTTGLPPPPSISITTLPMSGLLVDAYGLTEITSHSNPLTILWLLHPRFRTRARMSDIACRTIAHYNTTPPSQSHGLIALAFDMPNHGTRCVSPETNGSWKEGNMTHAIDMMGMVKGGKSDLSGLMDVAEGYLHGLLEREVTVEGNFVLGWSLGGHAAWQAWMGEGRVDGVVAVVGCADFVSLMSARAKNAHLDCGDTFLGSKYFPSSLLTTATAHDPKAILFNTDALPSLPLNHTEKTRLRQILDARGCLKHKKLLLCSGGEDRLVPWRHSEGFVEVLRDAGVDVDGGVYEGVGHKFSKDMVEDAVEWVCKAVGEGPREKARI